ncbi:ubiquinone biosynthesis methyltransferase COQ5 [Martensiomyces pterosporus]|nr:ubiquinone biosynthesis methyltransferase COQ5 [Martensiomyces pterosporus]
MVASPAAAAATRAITTTSKPTQKLLTASDLTSADAAVSDLYRDSVPIDSKADIMSDTYWKVAEKYTRVSNIMSFGGNPRWKSIFVNKMAPSPGDKLLDVAGGTCEIAKRYLAYQDKINGDRTSNVHVVDFNPGMLSAGKRRLSDTPWMKDGRVTFAQGDAENLANIPSNSVDIYSISAGMHNLAHPEKALDEAYRVLKPGGRFACLEYGFVESPVLRIATDWYWDRAVPFLGGILANDRASYARLVRSARSFPHQREFVKSIRKAGFYVHGQGYEPIYGGIMVAYFGIKPRTQPQSSK